MRGKKKDREYHGFLTVANPEKYKREKENRRRKMSLGRKFLEVLIQIALVPVAALITGCMLMTLTVIGFPLLFLGYIIEAFILDSLKDYTPEEGKTYHVAPSYKVSANSSGEFEVKYDNGERYTASGSEIAVGFIALFALPLRIITLLISIIALFFPSVNIKIKNNKGTWASIILDII